MTPSWNVGKPAMLVGARTGCQMRWGLDLGILLEAVVLFMVTSINYLVL